MPNFLGMPHLKYGVGSSDHPHITVGISGVATINHPNGRHIKVIDSRVSQFNTPNLDAKNTAFAVLPKMVAGSWFSMAPSR